MRDIKEVKEMTDKVEFHLIDLGLRTFDFPPIDMENVYKNYIQKASEKIISDYENYFKVKEE